jgi:hypothetical protein
MDTFLQVATYSRNLGPRDGLTSLFDTIACRLEPQGRGTRFPVVSRHLRLGRLSRREAELALPELDLIATELRRLQASKILWAGKQPAPASGSASAAEQLAAPDGTPLLEHLFAGARQAAHSGQVLRLNCPAQNRKELATALLIAAGGILWAVALHAWIPNWIIITAGQDSSDPTGIPIWTAGLLAPAFVVHMLAGLALPAFKVWSTLHTWGVAVWALLVVVLWVAYGLTR